MSRKKKNLVLIGNTEWYEQIESRHPLSRAWVVPPDRPPRRSPVVSNGSPQTRHPLNLEAVCL